MEGLELSHGLGSAVHALLLGSSVVVSSSGLDKGSLDFLLVQIGLRSRVELVVHCEALLQMCGKVVRVVGKASLGHSRHSVSTPGHVDELGSGFDGHAVVRELHLSFAEFLHQIFES
jgi:hypothetical protein